MFFNNEIVKLKNTVNKKMPQEFTGEYIIQRIYYLEDGRIRVALTPWFSYLSLPLEKCPEWYREFRVNHPHGMDGIMLVGEPEVILGNIIKTGIFNFNK